MNIHEREQALHAAVEIVCGADDDLRAIVTEHGQPPLYYRAPGFHSLLLTILEQQVSLLSARAAYDKLVRHLGDEAKVTPASVLQLNAAQLREFGFSHQKSRYVHALASSIASDNLNLEQLKTATDAEAIRQLTSVTGIGQWTANVYLIMALGRPDIWPVGDIAVASAIQKAKNLDQRPTGEKMAQWGDRWKPHRTAAAHILWHYYLTQK